MKAPHNPIANGTIHDARTGIIIYVLVIRVRYTNGRLTARNLSTVNKRRPNEDAPRTAAFSPDEIRQNASEDSTLDSKIDFLTQILNIRKGIDNADRRKSDAAWFIISICVTRRKVLLLKIDTSIHRFPIDPNNIAIPKSARTAISNVFN